MTQNVSTLTSGATEYRTLTASRGSVITGGQTFTISANAINSTPVGGAMVTYKVSVYGPKIGLSGYYDHSNGQYSCYSGKKITGGFVPASNQPEFTTPPQFTDLAWTVEGSAIKNLDMPSSPQDLNQTTGPVRCLTIPLSTADLSSSAPSWYWVKPGSHKVKLIGNVLYNGSSKPFSASIDVLVSLPYTITSNLQVQANPNKSIFNLLPDGSAQMYSGNPGPPFVPAVKFQIGVNGIRVPGATYKGKVFFIQLVSRPATWSYRRSDGATPPPPGSDPDVEGLDNSYSYDTYSFLADGTVGSSNDSPDISLPAAIEVPNTSAFLLIDKMSIQFTAKLYAMYLGPLATDIPIPIATKKWIWKSSIDDFSVLSSGDPIDTSFVSVPVASSKGVPDFPTWSHLIVNH